MANDPYRALGEDPAPSTHKPAITRDAWGSCRPWRLRRWFWAEFVDSGRLNCHRPCDDDRVRRPKGR